MTNPTDTQTSNLFDYAREQGRLSGEVRMLKWTVGAAFVALVAVLGAIYTEMNQGFREVNRQFLEVNGRIGELADGVTDVRERLTRVEGRFERIDEHVAELGAARTPPAPESPP